LQKTKVIAIITTKSMFANIRNTLGFMAGVKEQEVTKTVSIIRSRT